MNEKFKLLAEKSGFMMWSNEPWRPEDATVDWAAQYDSELEKFAELIVRECVQVVDEMADPEDSERYFWAIQNVSQKIKQHFGVEK